MAKKEAAIWAVEGLDSSGEWTWLCACETQGEAKSEKSDQALWNSGFWKDHRVSKYVRVKELDVDAVRVDRCSAVSPDGLPCTLNEEFHTTYHAYLGSKTDWKERAWPIKREATNSVECLCGSVSPHGIRCGLEKDHDGNHLATATKNKQLHAFLWKRNPPAQREVVGQD